MKKVNLFLFRHRNGNQIGIDFKYNLPLKEYLKNFSNLKWSQTFTCFYIAASRERLLLFMDFLKDGNIIADDSLIDYSKLKADYTEEIDRALNGEAFIKYLKGLRFSTSTGISPKSSLKCTPKIPIIPKVMWRDSLKNRLRGGIIP